MRLSIIQCSALALCLIAGAAGVVQGRLLLDIDEAHPQTDCACIALWAPVCDQETGKEYPNSQCAEACHGADPGNLKDGPCQPEQPCACIDLWEPVCDKNTGKHYANRDCAISCEGAKADDLGLCEAADEAKPEPPCPCQKSFKPVCDMSTGEQFDNEQCAVDCHGADPKQLQPCLAELAEKPGKHDDSHDDMCVSRPISCTYDLNECGVSSSCTCLPGYEYDARLGECLVADLANLERLMLPAVIPKTRETDLQNTCAISVPQAVPCTSDINVCGHSGQCVCPDGYAYDPRTALCLINH